MLCLPRKSAAVHSVAAVEEAVSGEGNAPIFLYWQWLVWSSVAHIYSPWHILVVAVLLWVVKRISSSIQDVSSSIRRLWFGGGSGCGTHRVRAGKPCEDHGIGRFYHGQPGTQYLSKHT